MRKRVWIGVAILLALAAITSIPFARRPKRSVLVEAYFQNTQGLRVGAPVRMAGVDVGQVTAIHVFPKLRDNPVEVSMSLTPEPAVDIPMDSTASLEAEGVLGPVFVDIDIRKTSGPPIRNGSTLKTISADVPTPQQFLERLSGAIKKNHTEDNQH